jgi:hypothetical protein
LEELTHSASWKAIMLRVVVPAQHSVTIVDTNTDQVSGEGDLLLHYYLRMQDVNIAEQMVNRGFAKWAEHIVAEPCPPFATSNHRNIGEDLQRRNDSRVDHVRLPGGHFPAFVMAVYSLNLFYIMVGIIHVYSMHVETRALHLSFPPPPLLSIACLLPKASC